MKRFHIALAVADMDASVADYSARLGQPPQAVVIDTYAMWRTDQLNFSIRKDAARAGQVVQIGFEDDAAEGFVSDTDINGIEWQRFSTLEQDLRIITTFGVPVHPAVEHELIRN
jgi:catechol 2,3-dioxygenase-like lactoylglutathione lyase family enzyme